jgi:hypothetical protein
LPTPHSTLKLKLLVVSFMQPLETYYSQEKEIWLGNNPNRVFTYYQSGFGGLQVACLTFRTQVRGLKPGRRRRIFQDEKKFLSTHSFGREVKLWLPCRRFTACKKIPECYVEVGYLQAKNLPAHFSPTEFPPLAARVSRRRLVAEVRNI